MENIAFPFDITSGEIKIADYAESIKQSVKIILLTRKGERIMNPEFGTNLKRYLFEPINQTVREIIKTEVINTLYQWENRIRDISVDIMDGGSGGNLHIMVNYNVPSLKVEDGVQVTIS
jgi:phage baseplate assembly protein W